MSEFSSSDFKVVPLSQLPVGATLQEPIFDGRNSGGNDILLLAAGKTFSQTALDQLNKRGVTEVRISVRELKRLKRARSRASVENNAAAQAAIKRASQEELRDAIEKFGITVHSHIHQVQRHGDTSYPSERVAVMVDQYEQSTQQLNALLEGVCKGSLPDASQMADASEESLNHIAADMDLVVALGITPAEGAYSSQHSLQTAMLAMSIGTTLGLKREQLVELGIGCLVHDAGMRFVPQELVNADRQLNQIEFLEITKHPSITFELLQRMPDIPTGARMVAYQMHERFDGSGYPRQRKGAQIHPLARIAMVADTFVAMISRRPYRPGVLPYKVMQFILHCTKMGKFDPDVVRGLLQTVSLFPLGSFVALSDGRIARVVRAHPEMFDRPIVEVQPQEGSTEEPAVINLAVSPELEIVRALPIPPKPLSAPICARS